MGLETVGVGLQLVVNLFFIGLPLGLGIKASFELVDFFKRKFQKLLWERDYQAFLERSEQADLDACMERRELEIEFVPESQEEAEFEGA